MKIALSDLTYLNLRANYEKTVLAFYKTEHLQISFTRLVCMQCIYDIYRT